MNEDKDEIVIVELPRWKVEKLETIIEERQAFDVITGKLKTWWVWVVVAGAVTIIALWDAIKLKVGS
jgi:hypothetical protein